MGVLFNFASLNIPLHKVGTMTPLPVQVAMRLAQCINQCTAIPSIWEIVLTAASAIQLFMLIAKRGIFSHYDAEMQLCYLLQKGEWP